LKLLSTVFVTSAARADGIPRDGVSQIAVAGRSNVGKSSLLNALCRSKIARTSAEPGKTRLANFYRASLAGGPGGPGRWDVYLVDLPGYGYARRSKASPRPERIEGRSDAAAELRDVAEAYFSAGRTAAVLLLVDSRHPQMPADVQAAEWLAQAGVEYHVVATKIDKLSRSERMKHLRTMEVQLGTAALPTSAASGEGLDELWSLIARKARKK
jgi:GTP-binding protein